MIDEAAHLQPEYRVNDVWVDTYVERWTSPHPGGPVVSRAVALDLALDLRDARQEVARRDALAADLLEACRAVLSQHDVYQQPLIPSVREKLEAAIAKAEGR